MRRLSLLAVMSLAGALFSMPAQADRSENFDSYPTGNVNGKGPWLDWGGPMPPDVVAGPANSDPNSLKLSCDTAGAGYGSDVLIATMDPSGLLTSGRWLLTYDLFVEASMTGRADMFLSQTPISVANGGHTMGVWVRADGGVVSLINGRTADVTPAIQYDQWVGVALDIDLDADLFTVSYGGTDMLSGGWDIDGSDATPTPSIGGLNFWADGAAGAVGSFYIDNFQLSFVSPPAPLVWDDGAGDGRWNSVDNWDLNEKPNNLHDCEIGPGYAVSVRSTDATAATVSVAAGSTLDIAAAGVLGLDGGSIAGILSGNGQLKMTGPIDVTGTLAPSGSLTLAGESRLKVDGFLAATIRADGIDHILLPSAGGNEVDVDVADATLELTATGRATIEGKPFGPRSLILIDNQAGGDLTGVGAATTPADGAPLGAGVFFDKVRFVDAIAQTMFVDVFQATPGDRNGDAKFEFDDIFTTFSVGGAKYESGEPATWTEGDFDNDQDFDFDDVFLAFSLSGAHYGSGLYYSPPAGNVEAATVPEPDTIVLTLGGLLALGALRSRS